MLSRTAASEFTARFGRPPRWVVAAPGRVNIIGEHTDYSGGLVLPMAIDRYTVIAAAPAAADAGRRLRLHSAAIDQSVDIPLAATPVPGEPRWANYARGVVAGFGARAWRAPALDALMISDVPLGGGLSSSAAFEVATATLLEAALGDAARADREGAPLPAGRARLRAGAVRDHGPADLGAGRRGGALLIDCRTQQTRLVPFADPSVSLLIANSNVRHSLGDGAYAARMSSAWRRRRSSASRELGQATPSMVAAAEATLGPLLYRRARHVVTENARTRAAADALRAATGPAPAHSCTRATARCATTTRSARPSWIRSSSSRTRSAPRAACTARA